MREIVVDTETTGLDPASGHRIVEIACVEIFNFVPTGATFHAYLNPERDMPREAFNVHGLSADFLREKPLFSAVASQFVDFVGSSRLIIHNADFDMRFLNFELRRLDMRPIGMAQVFDTLSFARKKHPGASCSLDALCARYRINNSQRKKHGALLDAELLAEVYIELSGGRQTTLSLATPKGKAIIVPAKARESRLTALPSPLNVATKDEHRLFIRSFKGRMIWLDFDEF